ncbi:MAG: FAD-dependent oxidoreductase [Sedimentisphaerales bacterium]|jgi:protoporphyrinogen oxidase
MPVETLILGAGLTGLSVAYHLGYRFLIVDANHKVGGTAGDIRYKKFCLDHGVHILYFRDAWTHQWITEELGVPLIKKERCSRVWLQERPVPFPVQFNLGVLPSPYRWKAGISAIIAAIRSNRDEEPSRMAQWSQMHFGKALTRDFFLPYNEKLWGVTFKSLRTEWMEGYTPAPSTHALIRGLFPRDNGHYGINSTFWYPKEGGIATIARAIAHKIGPIQFDMHLKSLDLQRHTALFCNGTRISYRYLVSTIPLPEIIRCVQPTMDTLSEKAPLLRSTPTTIVHILLPRPNIGGGVHWLYVPDPSIPFYRITFPHNINSTNCPEGWSAITLEFGGIVTDKARIERESKETLIKMGLMYHSEYGAESLWNQLDYGYVTYDDQWIATRNWILSFFRKHDVICLGRYGRWEYSNMESALLQGRDIHRRLRRTPEIPISFNTLSDRTKNSKIRDYFANRYPACLHGISRFAFRRGENSRLQQVYRWLPHCEGLDVLDAGCGDGMFLYQALRGMPARLRVEDFVPARVNEARRKLLHKADVIEAVIADVCEVSDSTCYDIVLAMGLFDYETDWCNLLNRLLVRVRGALIADFPKAGTLHNYVRKAWLCSHRIKLHSVYRSQLDTLFAKCSVRAQIVELPLHWMAKIWKESPREL